MRTLASRRSRGVEHRYPLLYRDMYSGGMDSGPTLSTHHVETCRLTTVSMLSRRIGPRIKRDREAKDWSQLDLANALSDVGGPRYSSRVSIWENSSSLPSESNRLLLAQVLEQPADRYFALSQPDDETQTSTNGTAKS